MHPLLRSSANPEKLSLTIKGILAGVATLVIAFGGPADFLEQLNPIVDFGTQAFVAVIGAYSALATLYGALRKLYFLWFKQD